MRKAICSTILSISLCGLGCDTNQVEPAIPVDSNPLPPRTTDVDIDIEGNRPLIEEGAERRVERRENLREAVDKIDVDVEPGGVDVDIK